MSDNDKLRAEFEAWAKANDLPIATYHFEKTWSYVDLRTAWAFEGWRAGQKAEREAIVQTIRTVRGSLAWQSKISFAALAELIENKPENEQ